MEIDQAAISGAVERVAAQRRQRHRSAWPAGLASCNVAERVTGMSDNAGAVRRTMPSGWVPCGVVVDGVLNEELRVWLRPRDGRAVAEVVPDAPAEAPRQTGFDERHPSGVRREWSRRWRGRRTSRRVARPRRPQSRSFTDAIPLEPA